MNQFISIIWPLVVVGLFYWLVNLLPLPDFIKTVIRVIAIILVIIYIISFIGKF